MGGHQRGICTWCTCVRVGLRVRVDIRKSTRSLTQERGQPDRLLLVPRIYAAVCCQCCTLRKDFLPFMWRYTLDMTKWHAVVSFPGLCC